MKKIAKTLAVFFILVGYTLFALVARLFMSEQSRRRFYLRQVHKHSRSILDIMGVEIEIIGQENYRAKQNYFVVSNHMSYLDALIMASIRPMCFVTSMEMREATGLGLLTEVGGCLYVERRSKENIHGEINEIVEALQDGLDVVVFPEATSTNGEKILPFKRALLSAAVGAQKPLLPMVIQYESLDGAAFTTQNRDALCWYGSMDFLPHFLNLMKYKSIRIRVSILPEIAVTKDSTRDTLVEQAFECIVKNYKPIRGSI